MSSEESSRLATGDSLSSEESSRSEDTDSCTDDMILLDLLLLQVTSVVAQPAAAPAVGRPAVVPS